MISVSPQATVSDPRTEVETHSVSENWNEHKFTLIGAGSVAMISAYSAISGGLFSNPVGWTVTAALVALTAIAYFVFQLFGSAIEEKESKPTLDREFSPILRPAHETGAPPPQHSLGAAATMARSHSTPAMQREGQQARSPQETELDPLPTGLGAWDRPLTSDLDDVPASPLSPEAERFVDQAFASAPPAARRRENPVTIMQTEQGLGEQLSILCSSIRDKLYAKIEGPTLTKKREQLQSLANTTGTLFKASVEKGKAVIENPRDHKRTAITAGLIYTAMILNAGYSIARFNP